MNNDLTDINFILDRSGSMSTIKDDTIGGFNSFIDSQKKAPGEATMSLHQFDDEYSTVYENINISEVVNLSDTTFVPRGMTALLDAIGRTINSTGARLAKLQEDKRPGKVIFVILTDGGENASKEFSHTKINEMITHQEETYDWDFIFLAANQDAIQTGAMLGIKAGNAMTFAATSKGTQDSYDTIAASMTMYRSASATMKKSNFFSDEDKAKQEV